MGGLRKYMPITTGHVLIGSLALTRHPAVRRLLLQGRDHRGGARCRTIAGRTASPTSRAGRRVRHRVLLVPHVLPGVPRQGALPTHAARHATHDDGARRRHGHGAPHESPWVVTVPLVLLAIPSVFAGWVRSSRCCSATTSATRSCRPAHDGWRAERGVARRLARSSLHGLDRAAVLARARRHRHRLVSATCKRPTCPSAIAQRFGPLYTLLDNKYYFDSFNDVVVRRRRARARPGLWKGGDRTIIDGMMVNGSARAGRLVLRRGAPAADRLHLPLRVRDDRRRPRRCLTLGAVAADRR